LNRALTDFLRLAGKRIMAHFCRALSGLMVNFKGSLAQVGFQAANLVFGGFGIFDWLNLI